MEQYILDYIRHIDPFIQEKDIQEATMVNEYDLFVKFKDGRKYIYDTYHNTFSGFYPDNHQLTDDEWNRSFKTRLRKMLSRKNVTQEELADRLGISRVTINRYINGQTIPSSLMLKKISLALDCDINEFFYKEF